MDYLVWTMLCFQGKLSVNSIASCHLSENLQNSIWFERGCCFRENWELNTLMSFSRKYRNRVPGLHHAVSSEKIEKLTA